MFVKLRVGAPSNWDRQRTVDAVLSRKVPLCPVFGLRCTYSSG